MPLSLSRSDYRGEELAAAAAAPFVRRRSCAACTRVVHREKERERESVSERVEGVSASHLAAFFRFVHKDDFKEAAV